MTKLYSAIIFVSIAVSSTLGETCYSGSSDKLATIQTCVDAQCFWQKVNGELTIFSCAPACPASAQDITDKKSFCCTSPRKCNCFTEGALADKFPCNPDEDPKLTYTADLEENKPIGTVVMTLEEKDPGDEALTYTMSGNDFFLLKGREIQTKKVFDFEDSGPPFAQGTKKSILPGLNVREGSKPHRAVTATITLKDKAEPFVVAMVSEPAPVTVREDSTDETLIFGATLTDPDTDPNKRKIKVTLTPTNEFAVFYDDTKISSDSTAFAIVDGKEFGVKKKAMVLPYMENSIYRVVIKITQEDSATVYEKTILVVVDPVYIVIAPKTGTSVIRHAKELHSDTIIKIYNIYIPGNTNPNQYTIKLWECEDSKVCENGKPKTCNSTQLFYSVEQTTSTSFNLKIGESNAEKYTKVCIEAGIERSTGLHMIDLRPDLCPSLINSLTIPEDTATNADLYTLTENTANRIMTYSVAGSGIPIKISGNKIQLDSVVDYETRKTYTGITIIEVAKNKDDITMCTEEGPLAVTVGNSNDPPTTAMGGANKIATVDDGPATASLDPPVEFTLNDKDTTCSFQMYTIELKTKAGSVSPHFKASSSGACGTGALCQAGTCKIAVTRSGENIIWSKDLKYELVLKVTQGAFTKNQNIEITVNTKPSFDKASYTFAAYEKDKVETELGTVNIRNPLSATNSMDVTIKLTQQNDCQKTPASGETDTTKIVWNDEKKAPANKLLVKESLGNSGTRVFCIRATVDGKSAVAKITLVVAHGEAVCPPPTEPTIFSTGRANTVLSYDNANKLVGEFIVHPACALSMAIFPLGAPWAGLLELRTVEKFGYIVVSLYTKSAGVTSEDICKVTKIQPIVVIGAELRSGRQDSSVGPPILAEISITPKPVTGSKPCDEVEKEGNGNRLQCYFCANCAFTSTKAQYMTRICDAGQSCCTLETSQSRSTGCATVDTTTTAGDCCDTDLCNSGRRFAPSIFLGFVLALIL